jgi:hypothetical protein
MEHPVQVEQLGYKVLVVLELLELAGHLELLERLGLEVQLAAPV